MGTKLTRSLAVVLVAAWAPLGGCNEEVGHGPNPCNADTCDVLERDCQERVMEVIRCFRGGDEDVMPDVDVISEEDYIELITGDELSEDERTAYERFARGMALFQLSPEMPDYETDVSEYAENIAAAYLTDDERVVLIDRGEPLDSPAAFATFAHELVHALQDRELDLEAFYQNVRPTLDGTLAARALIEGEATHYDLLISAALQGLHPALINWGGYYADYQIEMLIEGYEDDAPLILSLVRFPYAFGGDYVSDRWFGGGQAAVARLFEEPPLSTSDVITFGATSDDDLEEIEAFREGSRLAPIEGYELVAYDELGSFVLDGFLHRLELTEDPLLDVRVLWLLADGATVLHRAEDDSVVAAWRLHFAPGKVPDEQTIELWRQALGAPAEASPEPGDDVTARVLTDGDDVILIASDAPLDAAWLGDELTWDPALDDDEMEETMPTAAKLCGRHCRPR